MIKPLLSDWNSLKIIYKKIDKSIIRSYNTIKAMKGI